MAKTETRNVIIKITDTGLKEVTASLKEIARLATKLEKTDINPGTKGVKKTTAAVDDYSLSLSDADRANKSLANSSGKGAKDFAKQAQGLGGLVHVYATVAANIWAVTAAFQGLKNAADISVVAKAQEELSASSGKSLTAMTRAFQEGSDGALSLANAMKQASQAASAGFGGQFVKDLSKVAAGASKAFGRDITDAMDRLTRGIAKMEPEILDELGLFVKIGPAAQKYAQAHNKAASELTEFERRQAFANEAIEQGLEKFGNLAEAIETNPYDKLSAALADLAQSVFEGLNAFIKFTGVFDALSENAGLLTAGISLLGIKLAKLAMPQLDFFSEESKLSQVTDFNTAASELDKTLDDITRKDFKSFEIADNAREQATDLGIMTTSMKKNFDATEDLGEAWEKSSAGLEKSANAQLKHIVASQKSGTALTTLGRFKGLPPGALDSVEEFGEELSGIGKIVQTNTGLFDDNGKQIVESTFVVNKGLKETQAGLEKQILAAKANSKATIKSGIAYKGAFLQGLTGSERLYTSLLKNNAALAGATRAARAYGAALYFVGKGARFVGEAVSKIISRLGLILLGYELLKAPVTWLIEKMGAMESLLEGIDKIKIAFGFDPRGISELSDATAQLKDDMKAAQEGYIKYQNQIEQGNFSFTKGLEIADGAVNQLKDSFENFRVLLKKLSEADYIAALTPKSLVAQVEQLATSAEGVGRISLAADLRAAYQPGQDIEASVLRIADILEVAGFRAKEAVFNVKEWEKASTDLTAETEKYITSLKRTKSPLDGISKLYEKSIFGIQRTAAEEVKWNKLKGETVYTEKLAQQEREKDLNSTNQKLITLQTQYESLKTTIENGPSIADAFTGDYDAALIKMGKVKADLDKRTASQASLKKETDKNVGISINLKADDNEFVDEINAKIAQLGGLSPLELRLAGIKEEDIDAFGEDVSKLRDLDILNDENYALFQELEKKYGTGFGAIIALAKDTARQLAGFDAQLATTSQKLFDATAVDKITLKASVASGSITDDEAAVKGGDIAALEAASAIEERRLELKKEEVTLLSQQKTLNLEIGTDAKLATDDQKANRILIQAELDLARAKIGIIGQEAKLHKSSATIQKANLVRTQGLKKAQKDLANSAKLEVGFAKNNLKLQTGVAKAKLAAKKATATSGQSFKAEEIGLQIAEEQGKLKISNLEADKKIEAQLLAKGALEEELGANQVAMYLGAESFTTAQLAAKQLELENTAAGIVLLEEQKSATNQLTESQLETLKIQEELASIAAPFEELGAAIDALDDSPFKSLVKGANDFAKATELGEKKLSLLDKGSQEYSKQQLENYGAQAGALGSMFDEGTAAAKVFNGIEQVAHAMRMAMMVTEMLGIQSKAAAEIAAETATAGPKAMGASLSIVSSMGPWGIGIAAAFVAAMFSMGGKSGGSGGVSGAGKATKTLEANENRLGENGISGQESLQTNALTESINALIDVDANLFTGMFKLQKTIVKLDKSFKSIGGSLNRAFGGSITEKGLTDNFSGVEEFGEDIVAPGASGINSKRGFRRTLESVTLDIDPSVSKSLIDPASIKKASDLFTVSFQGLSTTVLAQVTKYYRDERGDKSTKIEEITSELAAGAASELAGDLEAAFINTIDTTFDLLLALDPASHVGEATTTFRDELISNMVTALDNGTLFNGMESLGAGLAADAQASFTNGAESYGQYAIPDNVRANMAQQATQGGGTSISVGDDAQENIDRISEYFNSLGNSALLALLPGIEAFQQLGEEAGDAAARMVEEIGIIVNTFTVLGFKGTIFDPDAIGAAGVLANLAFNKGLLSGFKDTEGFSELAELFIGYTLTDVERLGNIKEARNKQAFAGIEAVILELTDFGKLEGTSGYVQELSNLSDELANGSITAAQALTRFDTIQDSIAQTINATGDLTNEEATALGNLTGVLITGTVSVGQYADATNDFIEAQKESTVGLQGLTKETRLFMKTLDNLLGTNVFGGLADDVRDQLIDAFGSESDFTGVGQTFVDTFFSDLEIQAASFDAASTTVGEAINAVLEAGSELADPSGLVKGLTSLASQYEVGAISAQEYKNKLGALLKGNGGIASVISALGDMGAQGIELGAALLSIGEPFENLLSILPDVIGDLGSLNSALKALTGLDFQNLLGDPTSDFAQGFQGAIGSDVDATGILQTLADASSNQGGQADAIFNAAVEDLHESNSKLLTFISGLNPAGTFDTETNNLLSMVVDAITLVDKSIVEGDTSAARNADSFVADLATAILPGLANSDLNNEQFGTVAGYLGTIVSDTVTASDAAGEAIKQKYQDLIDPLQDRVDSLKRTINANNAKIAEYQKALDDVNKKMEEFQNLVSALSSIESSTEGLVERLIGSQAGSLGGALLSIDSEAADAAKGIEASIKLLQDMGGQSALIADLQNLKIKTEEAYQALLAVEINNFLVEMAGSIASFRDEIVMAQRDLDLGFYGIVEGLVAAAAQFEVTAGFLEGMPSIAQLNYDNAIKDLTKASTTANLLFNNIGGSLFDLSLIDVTNIDKVEGGVSALSTLKDSLLAVFEAESALNTLMVEETTSLLADFLSAIEGIKATVDSLLLGELSPLSAGQKLELSKGAFDEIVSALATEDDPAKRIELLNKISDAGTSYLELSKEYYAGTGNYVAEFDRVRSILEDLAEGGEGTVTGTVEEQILTKLQESYDAALESYTTTSEQLEALDSAVGDVNLAGLPALAALLENLTTYSQNESLFDGLQGNLQAISTDLSQALIDNLGPGSDFSDGVLNIAGALTTSLTPISTAITTAMNAIAGLVTQAEAIATKIGALVTANEAIAGTIGGLESAISGFKDDLAAELNANPSWASTLSGAITSLATAIGGMSQGSSVDQAINSLYQDNLGRNADVGGLANYGSQVTSGALTLPDVASQLLNSPEAAGIAETGQTNSVLTGNTVLGTGQDDANNQGGTPTDPNLTNKINAAQLHTVNMGISAEVENAYHAGGRHGDTAGVAAWAKRIEEDPDNKASMLSTISTEVAREDGTKARQAGTLFDKYNLYAKGGISSEPAIFGEAGPEAAVPLPDGRRIPVDMGTNSMDSDGIIAELRALRDELQTQTQLNLEAQQQLAQLLDEGNGINADTANSTKKAVRRQEGASSL